MPLDISMKWLEQMLRRSTATVPTPFDEFCQKKLEEFRTNVAMTMSTEVPIKAKLNQLVGLIVRLHEPGCRGNYLKLATAHFHL